MEYVFSLVDKVVLVLTLDGRCIVGLLRGCDPLCNIVLEDSHERVFSNDKGMEQEPLGLYVVRGDSIAVVGELDEAKDKQVDWSRVSGGIPGAILLGAV